MLNMKVDSPIYRSVRSVHHDIANGLRYECVSGRFIAAHRAYKRRAPHKKAPKTASVGSIAGLMPIAPLLLPWFELAEAPEELAALLEPEPPLLEAAPAPEDPEPPPAAPAAAPPAELVGAAAGAEDTRPVIPFEIVETTWQFEELGIDWANGGVDSPDLPFV